MGRLVGFLVVLLLIGSYSPLEVLPADEEKSSRQKIIFSPSGFTVLAEKADSEQKRRKGLMGRKSLTDQEGMIFYFEETDRHAFWMFNTHIPLAVVFVDENKIVVDVQYMAPCLNKKPENCPTYVSRRPSRLAIEINQNAAKKHRLRVGNRIILDDG